MSAGSRWSERLGLLALVALFCVHAWHLLVVCEDAYITFRFARHWTAGEGFVWNVGEAPVEGFTNLLWLFLCSLVLRLGGDLEAAMPVLGVLCGAGVVAWTWRIGRRHLELDGERALVPPALLVAAGPLATWSGSGLETALFTLLLLFALDAFLRGVRDGSGGGLALSSAWLFAATLTRPEGVILFAVFAVWGSWRRPGARVVAALVYLTPLGLLTAWRVSTFGVPLPNTFYAKTGGAWLQYLRGVKYVVLFVMSFGLPLVPWIWLRSSRRADLAPGTSAPLVLAVTALSAFVVYAGGDYMAMFRFFVPVLPFAALLLGGWFTSGPWTGVERGFFALAVAGLLLQSTPLEARLFPRFRLMHGTWRGVQYERFCVARYHAIADSFEGLVETGDESLTLYPIGVVPYRLPIAIHAADALVEPELARRKVEGLGSGLAGHEKRSLVFALRKAPRWFVDSVELFDEPPARPSNFEPEVRELLEAEYAWTHRLVEDRPNGRTGYLGYFERREP